MWDIWHSGSYIYGAGEDKFYIYDDVNGDVLDDISTDGKAYGVYASGDYAYLASEAGLEVYDVSTPSSLSHVRTVETSLDFVKVRGAGNYLYATAESDNTLRIFDISSDASDPSLVGTYDPAAGGNPGFTGNIRGLYVDAPNDLVYFVNDQADLYIVDVSTPSSPSTEGHLFLPEIGANKHPGGGVRVHQDYAYLTTANGNDDGFLYWVDVSDPANPTEIASYYDAARGLNEPYAEGCWIHVATHDGWTVYKMSGFQPDNQIKNDGDASYIGDDIYNEDGTDQTKSQEVNPNVTATYQIKVENDADRNDEFKLSNASPNPVPSGWTLQYFDGGTDVTAQIMAGTYSTGDLSAGASKDITLEVTPDGAASCDASIDVKVRAVSTTCSDGCTSGSVDVVVARTTMRCPPPEITIDKTLTSGDPAYVGQEVVFNIRITNTGQSTIVQLPLQDIYDPTELAYLGATPNSDDNVDDGVIDWSDLTQAGLKGFGVDLAPGQHFDVELRFRALKATTTSAAANAVSPHGMAALTTDPDVDGLLDDSYTFVKRTDPGADAPGNLYRYDGASECYYAFVVDRSFNDNVYAEDGDPVNGFPTGLDYVGFDGWNKHKFKDLTGSDQANFNIVGLPGTLELDYVTSDGSGGFEIDYFNNAPAGSVGATSLLWNLQSSGWDGTYPGENPDDKRYSPPYDWNDTPGQYWEWHMIYEFSIPKSEMGGTCGSVDLGGAHNSPSKADDSLGVIGDTVFTDSNDNGQQDAGEPGIPGVRINLKQGGATIRTTETEPGTTGYYLFGNMKEGTYVVDVDESTLPAGYTLTSNEPLTVNLASDQDYLDADFGYSFGTASIGNRVFYDLDNSGLPDDGSEPGLNGVTVDLYEGVCPGSGQPYKTQATSGNGDYDFTSLPQGDYCVDVDESTLPVGFGPTIAQPQDVDLGDGEDFNDADFGYQAQCPPGTIPNLGMSSGAEDENGREANIAIDYICIEVIPVRGAIGDFVWYDADADGIEDVGEAGIPNVALDLYRDSNSSGALEIGVDQLVASTQTDADGGYLFPKLQPDLYFVDVTAAANPNGPLNGLTHTLGNQSMNDPAGPINLTAGQVYKDADFGYVREEPGLAIIGDTVWYDGNGDGVQQPGEPGIPGIEVKATENGGVSYTATTDANGHYWHTVLPGTYLIDVTTPPAGLNPTTQEPHGPVTVVAGDQYLKADFGYMGEILGVIGDLVFEDANESGQYDGGDTPLAGVSVSLIRDSNGNGVWNAGEAIIATTTTDSSLDVNGGNYQFNGVPAGHYLVHVSDTNGVLLDYFKGPLGATGVNNHSQADPYPVYLAQPGDDNLTADFGYVPLDITDKGVTGNQVWLESDGNGIFSTVSGDIGQHGVTVELLQSGNVIQTTTTGASGDYAFLHLPPGNYDTQVTDAFGVLSGFQPSIYPADQSSDHTNKIQAYATGLPAGGVNLTADFGYLCVPKLRGFIWRDMNLDGVRDPGETGIADIEVAILADEPNRPLVAITRTDADGFYTFDNLPAGNYIIDVNNSYINFNLQLFLTTPPEPAPKNLGECEIGFRDFGYGPKGGVIGNFVWYDVNKNVLQDEWYDANDNDLYDEWYDGNGNGFIDEGELDKCGLRLISVALKDAAASPLQDTLTDHFGFYNFIDLPGGTYRVSVDQTEVFARATDMAIEGLCKPLPADAPLTTAAQSDASAGADDLAGITTLGEGSEIVLASRGPEQVPADIGGQVREDRDADGDLGDTDPGIVGVTIELYADNNGDGMLDAGDTLLSTTTTIADGYYTFPQQAAPGQYIVVEDDPAGMGSTNDTAPPNNNQIPVTLTSGVNSTGNDFLDTIVNCHLSPDGDIIVDLPAGGVYLDADFAASCVLGSGVIGDFVWYDKNGDGVQDVGEPGIANVTLDLYEDTDGNGSGDTLVESTVTGAAGGYLFDGVPPGDYVVDVTDQNSQLTGLTLTTGPQSQPDPSNAIPLAAGEVYRDADFGYKPLPSNYTISKVLASGSPARPNEDVTFDITITNTGGTWLVVAPLADDYDPDYLTFKFADTLPDSVDSVAGVLTWTDITLNPAQDLAPGASFTVSVTFTAVKDTTDPWLPPNGTTVNTATVTDAWADPDGPDGPFDPDIPLPEKSDDAEIKIIQPTGLELSSFAAEERDGGVDVSWETYLELVMLGFNVQRSVAGGDFETLNAELIIAEHAGSSGGGAYEYRDETIQPGGSYQYRLEIIKLDGSSVVYGLSEVTTLGLRLSPSPPPAID